MERAVYCTDCNKIIKQHSSQLEDEKKKTANKEVGKKKCEEIIGICSECEKKDIERLNRLKRSY